MARCDSQIYRTNNPGSELDPGLDIDARRQCRRLRLPRATNDRERGRAGGEHDRGSTGEHPWPRPAPPGAPGLLQRFWQTGNHILGCCQLLRQSLLGAVQIVGEPTLVVTPAQAGGSGLCGVNTKADQSAGHVHRADRRAGQAAAQPLPRGQRGVVLCAHLLPFRRTAWGYLQPATRVRAPDVRWRGP
jgi:hypothetical protein